MIRAEQKVDFYEVIEPRLHHRIGHELRLAGHVLALGYASCNLAQYLTRAYRQHVTGVNICPETVHSQRRSWSRPGDRCGHTFVTDLDFIADLSVDAVVIMWALPDTERPKKVLRGANCVLRPGGEILIVESPKDSLARGLWYEDYNRSDELASMLDLAGFQEVKIELIEQGRIIWAVGFRPEWL